MILIIIENKATLDGKMEMFLRGCQTGLCEQIVDTVKRMERAERPRNSARLADIGA